MSAIRPPHSLPEKVISDSSRSSRSLMASAVLTRASGTAISPLPTSPGGSLPRLALRARCSALLAADVADMASLSASSASRRASASFLLSFFDGGYSVAARISPDAGVVSTTTSGAASSSSASAYLGTGSLEAICDLRQGKARERRSSGSR